MELAKTDLSIYPIVFNKDIFQVNLSYYPAYYHKKQDANSDDLLPFRDNDYIIKICIYLRYFALKDLIKRIWKALDLKRLCKGSKFALKDTHLLCGRGEGLTAIFRACIWAKNRVKTGL